VLSNHTRSFDADFEQQIGAIQFSLGSLGLAGQLLNGARTLFEVFRPSS
jgi:hypothetical protein